LKRRVVSDLPARQFFALASLLGTAGLDPAAHLGDALKSKPKTIHHPAIRADQAGAFLIRLGYHDCAVETRVGIELAALTVTRTTELRFGDWAEFECLDEPERAMWRIPPERMKMNEEHLVPLLRQAVKLLLTLPSASRRGGKLFPSHGGEGVMSNNTMLYAIYDMDYKGPMTTHGFRSLF